MAKPGRPRVDPHDTSVQLCVTVPGQVYDELWRLAKRDEVSVAEVARQRLAVVMIHERDPDR